MRIKSKRNHLADLLSRKDVKEGFDRKPTTKDQNEVDLQGYTWRYAERKRRIPVLNRGTGKRLI